MTSADRYTQLVYTIKQNPGIQFRQLMRLTGMKNGVLSHYMTRLEKSGTVQVKRTSRQTRFYPPHITDNETKVISAIRRPTPRDIILTLILHDGGLEFREVVKEVKKSPSTISLYMSQLLQDGIVKMKLVNRKKLYQINNVQKIDKLIEDYYPKLMEKAVSSFEDIVNSL